MVIDCSYSGDSDGVTMSLVEEPVYNDTDDFKPQEAGHGESGTQRFTFSFRARTTAYCILVLRYK